jgi:hypothetical protein
MMLLDTAGKVVAVNSVDHRQGPRRAACWARTSKSAAWFASAAKGDF